MAETKPAPDIKVAYFPVGPHVTQEIDEWARKTGKRILSIVPVYWEDVQHG